MKVIHSHDGAADDQMALLLLTSLHKSKQINLLAVSVLPADSRAKPAIQMSNKIVENMDIPVIFNDKETPNKFPDEWRDETIKICKLMDADHDKYYKYEKLEKLIQIIKKHNDITFIETGSLTTLADCLKIDASIKHNIIRIVWTGGCFDNNPGKSIKKIDDVVMDGTQSWNAFIDPISAKYVIDSDMKIIIFPSELTNQVKLSGIYHKLPYTETGEIFRKVYAEYINDESYCVWDVFTASYVGGEPDIELDFRSIDIITDGISTGKTIESPDGTPVFIIKSFKDPYSHILKLISNEY